ncbi:MAG: DUF4114 domain-containing protein [Leptolyngbya sp. SIO1D8]|nr:DUF4114 domain-containing protein [Leptolyngbya sp. SIO1D8]
MSVNSTQENINSLDNINSQSINEFILDANADLSILSLQKTNQTSESIGFDEALIEAYLQADIELNSNFLGQSLSTSITAIETVSLTSSLSLNTTDRTVGEDLLTGSFDSGVFTVGQSGEVSLDFLFDGGKFEGELAIINLSSLEGYELGSKAFVKEASRLALTHSMEGGYVVISDGTEGARFDGILGEHENQAWNHDEYLGVKTFAMNPGDRFGFMFTPKGSIQSLFKRPIVEGAKSPMFSMSTANSGPLNGQQFADVTGDGHTFAIEDLSLDKKSDQDYNDFIFQLQGATGNLESLNSLINSDYDWQTTDLGIAFQDFATFDPTTPPSIQVSDSVRYAINRATNLEQYDPAVLARTREWVVGISETQSVGSVAFLLGVENLGEARFIDSTYVFKFSDQESTQDIIQQLNNLPGVEFSYPLIAQQRPNRLIPNDSLYNQQWHLDNSGQTGGTSGLDANIENAWNLALGNGVVIGIVDDGLQHIHPDLNPQYREDLSFDFFDNDSDPLSGEFDFHGTAVAGIAAGAGNNGVGITGAAPNASLAGLRLTSGFNTDQQQASALSHENQDIPIYNNSWGPRDDGSP